ncbi:TonB-dependent receptor [Bacteroides sp. 224]|uniref:TonB-dependent receptor n=1 Tax=Bacteroides sp. 224 TaxID=2302936 RepID=UPI0013D77446|nr:TonB-dependent receptor [Bacteroides sp. 224]NDV64089.1 TonB-dependent receptor [Bacteroides sp. 224]
MKKPAILIALSFLFTVNLLAEDRDTLKVVDIEEVMVIASPKENRKLREQPASVTLLSQQDMQVNQVNSIKNLTGLVPNMFIPDYGSKMTSAVYIRGIGSRINTPSVGLYVDNIPFIDKSAFDFSYADVERIDILRGPQGTLYGRNTMGGLIRIHTKNPFNYQGTDVQIEAATRNGYKASVTHYHRLSDQFAFSAGGFYEYSGGFFKNSFNNKKIDKSDATGGRIRAIYFPSQNFKIDATVNYEYSDQGGYPYAYTGRVNPEDDDKRKDYIDKISIKDNTYYRRNLLNAGVNMEYQAKDFTLNMVTGYQYLKDNMLLDQDFTERDIFTMQQKQQINTISEEVILKSKSGRKWEWTTGAFGFYQWLKTNAPVTFKEEGIRTTIEENANSKFPNSPAAPTMIFSVNNSQLPIRDDFKTPILNAAIYHQSTINDLFIKGLSFTAGLRLDYEKIKIDYDCESDPLDFNFSMQMPGAPFPTVDTMEAPTTLKGKADHDYMQLLPKFSLQYEWKKNNSIYFTVSKGYRSGGYNVQMFSDLVSQEMRGSMKTALMESNKFNKYAAMIDKMMPAVKIDPDTASIYKPEHTWSYEIGSHLTFWGGRLQADLAAFYMDTKNQQISQFVESGLGRITVNAGKSRSYGAEVALRTILSEALSFNATYGYTRSTFREYNAGNGIDYKGNTVPFAPKHTFNVGGQYTANLTSCKLLDQIQFNLNYAGAGRIYWTEQNDVSQSFYGTLNSRLAFNKGNGQIAFWAQNILNKKYDAFYFESMGNGFAQRGRPVQVGVEVRCRF